MISGALLYIRDDFKVVDNSTILQVRFSISLASANLIQLDIPLGTVTTKSFSYASD